MHPRESSYSQLSPSFRSTLEIDASRDQPLPRRVRLTRYPAEVGRRQVRYGRAEDGPVECIEEFAANDQRHPLAQLNPAHQAERLVAEVGAAQFAVRPRCRAELIAGRDAECVPVDPGIR